MYKAPLVTLAFWIIKISATTLGETGGDALSMSENLGYAVSTGIFFAIFVILLAAQVASRRFSPWLYWAVIVATTMCGTTMSDFLTRSAGLGYLWTSILLFAVLMMVLLAWHLVIGSVSVNRIATPRVELFYWTAILFSNTLGTALGDAVADSGPGYEGGALVFAGVLAVIAAAYLWTRLSHTLLFWSAFILTRPLGATLGDLLTKPHADGGLALSRIAASLIIAVFIIACILFTSQKPERPAAQHGSTG
jgi:uncharacterized membrane-anchored protein